MSDNPFGDLYVTARREEARSGLEEEERLFRDGVVELLGVFAVVATNSNNLFEARKLG